MEQENEKISFSSTLYPPTQFKLALIPLGIALNLAVGTIISILKIPIYMDAVGTIIVTLLAGLGAGIATGVLSFIIGGVLTNPVLPYFAGTQAVIAIYVYFLAKHAAFSTTFKTILSGIGLGVIAGIVSAPIIVYLFGGITGSGRSLITAYLLATGKNILKSVILTGAAAEPIDKTFQCLLAIWLLKGVPKSFLRRFKSLSLERNNLI